MPRKPRELQGDYAATVAGRIWRRGSLASPQRRPQSRLRAGAAAVGTQVFRAW